MSYFQQTQQQQQTQNLDSRVSCPTSQHTAE